MGEFLKFKPVCVDLLKDPSVGKLAKLKELIDESNEEALNQLQEYILFPLFIVSSNTETRNEKIFCAVGSCLQALCKKTTIRVYKIFSDFLLQLLLILHNINPNENKLGASEEVKVVAVESILALLKASSNDILVELLSEKSKPLLGHLVITLLKVAANEEMNELRLAALNTLMEFSSIPASELGSSLASFFPGICTHMLKTINGAIKQSHVVTKKAIAVFSKIIRIVLNNHRFENAGESENEWLQKTRSNLHLVFEKMMKNPDMHWKVKIEMAAMVTGVVEDCSVTLEPSLPLLIKKLVQFTADECLEVERAAQERILNFSQSDFDSAVRQNLYDIVTSLPRIVTQGITHDQLVVLQELQGHLILLGPRLELSLIFSGLRQRLFKGLLIAVTLEPAKVSERDDLVSLQYLREDRVISRFESCCSLIGRHANLADTVDYLLDVVRHKESFDKESVYVMKYVLKGAAVDLSVFTTVIREYSTYLTQLTIENKNDIILGKLMLLVIGEAAIKMRTDFTPMLLTTLKPVLEKAGHPIFHDAGVQALQCMTEALQLTSISQLLEENVDYFAPQLSFQLRNIFRYPRAIDLLRGLLLLSDIRMDHWLEQMVHHALKGLDRSHTTRALPYIQVLELYSKAAFNARPNGPACAKPLSKGEALNVEEVAVRIADYKTNIKLSKEYLEVNEDVVEDSALEEPQDQEEEQQTEMTPPSEVTLVADIFDRCIQLLPQSTDELLYSGLMQTIRYSIDVLCHHENIFLPKVHQLWEPLRNQLLGSSHLKQRQAFEIFLSLVRRCPDFIRHRAVKEVVPKLVTFLHSQAAASRGRSSRAHIASQAYKLQKSILSSMAFLVEFLDPPVLEVGKIVQTTCLYLSNQQISELQNLAKDNLITIAKYHSGSVWLTLYSLVARRTLRRPGFRDIEVGTLNEDCEFTANAEELVNKLFVTRN